MRLPAALKTSTSAAAVATLTTSLLLTAAPAQAAPSVDQELPFACGEVWAGSTRASHSPSFWSVDFNRDADFRRPVLASSPGHVYRVNDVGDTSYGKYVFIDHGNGESTVYAHLDRFLVQEGAYVDQGDVIGLLGNSGGSFGAHLHYEQRYGSTAGQPFFHQYPFVFDSGLASRNCANAPLTGDWDGDGDSDRAVFARGRKGVFRLKVGKEVRRLELGRGTDQVVTGDWDGDGTDGVAVRDPDTRAVTLQDLDGTGASVRFAPRTTQLLAGDWDGDGVDSLGFYRPKAKQFLLLTPGERKKRIRWGAAGSLPVTGDWDGDGRDDVGSFDPADAEFSLRVLDPVTGEATEVLVPVTVVDKEEPAPEPDPFDPSDPEAVEEAVTGAVEPDDSFDPDAEEVDPAPDPTVTDPDADPAEPETAEVVPTTPEPEPETDGGFDLPTDSLASAPLPVVGDWNGDGRSDLGLWDPATATWTSWVVNSLERRASPARDQKFGRPRF